jgi:hypothetical protein
MNAPTEAAAVKAALETHEWWLAGNLGVPGMKDATTYKCLCGWNGDDPRGHQAAAVLAALNLTDETAFRYTHLASGRSTILESTSSDVRVARRIAGDTHELTEVERLVGPWVAASREEPTMALRDEDGDLLCTQCVMPEPAEWCWRQSVSCPFGKPPRSQP